MCGIVGFVDFKNACSERELEAMQATLAHRGPNDKGHHLFTNESNRVGIAHTRLSILDISELGHQPMQYEHYWIVLNGEVYNYREIKRELESMGHCFRSSSDTEVVLHAFAEWGLSCVDRFIGMFAFVIYDEKNRKLFGCRDRVGVKPFHYYFNGALFLFASELKAFHASSIFRSHCKLNGQGVARFVKYGYVPGPESIFDSTYKLPAASWLILNCETKEFSITRYWDIEKSFLASSFDLSYEETKVEVEKLIVSACTYRMVSDVPVGIFLSGGFDSTLVTTVLQRDSTTRLKTFTIGFPDGVDEAPFAKKIANHLGTDHTSYDCTDNDAKMIVPELSDYFDEPFADISAIPTILVSRLAKKTVTVVLSADGGDEIFAGYDGFSEYDKRLKFLSKFPVPSLVGAGLRVGANILPDRYYAVKRKTAGLAELLLTGDDRRPASLVQQTLGLPDRLVANLLIDKRKIKPTYNFESSKFADYRNLFLYSSFQTSLTDQLLVKMDRATMSASLEGREPLLDHRLVEFGGRIPYDFKNNGKISKRIIRDIVYEHVPKQLMDRRKIGFDLPIYKWLKADLSYLIDELLGTNAIADSGIFVPAEVEAIKHQFRTGKLYYESLLWRIIVFQLWYNKWMK